MLGSNYRPIPNKRNWAAGLVVLWLVGWLSGCASVPSEPAGEYAICSAWADAAVEAGQLPLAVERHEKVLSSDRSNCLAMYHLGYIWGRLDDHSKEIVWYNNAIACGYVQSDTLYFNMGMAYADLRQIDSAIEAFKQAIHLNPDKADNHFGLGMTAHANRDMVAAERALKQAIAISPHHWDARMLLVEMYLDQGNLEAAGRHLEFILERVPHNDEANNFYKLYKERRMTEYGR